MIIIGKVYGAKDPLFLELLNKDRAYLMGRMLTVETRLKNFKESVYPNAVNLYYNKEAYKRMLVTLTETLI